ncbi:MAG TPA: hypothetical protein VJK72_03985 [Candidatus Nanoarchaeia archaeon]|nr:hypothetical protein [Candidatus Nanoarchaeia archaeon]
MLESEQKKEGEKKSLVGRKRLAAIEKACGMTKGAKPFVRDREDREFE